MKKLVRYLSILTLLIAITGGTFTAAQAQTSTKKLRFVVVTHGQAADPFWSVVKRGVEQAGKDENVDVQYEAPPTYDMVAMSNLIDGAVASKPDGLVVSIPDANALSPAIKRAIAAGIPVISINSGSDVAAKLGVLVHVGQTEYEAGLAGGQRMAAAGVKNALCDIQEAGNAGLEDRCRGFTDSMTKAGSKVKNIVTDLNDPTGSQQRLQAALTADPTIDGIMALGPTGATPALKAIQASNKTGKVKLATFDLSTDVLNAIKNGDMLFAIDQQQYLQGYLPIVLLALYNRNDNTIANPILMTGPGFVTKDNVDKVMQLTKEGTR